MAFPGFRPSAFIRATGCCCSPDAPRRKSPWGEIRGGRWMCENACVIGCEWHFPDSGLRPASGLRGLRGVIRRNRVANPLDYRHPNRWVIRRYVRIGETRNAAIQWRWLRGGVLPGCNGCMRRGVPGLGHLGWCVPNIGVAIRRIRRFHPETRVRRRLQALG